MAIKEPWVPSMITVNAVAVSISEELDGSNPSLRLSPAAPDIDFSADDSEYRKQLEEYQAAP